MIPPPAMPNANSTTNVIKKLFMKYTDIDEQKYSEKCIIALKIMDILFKTEQCTKEEYQKVKDLVIYTKDNLNISVYQLDMMVSPQYRLPYAESKMHVKVFKRYTNDERIELEDVKYRLCDIQEIMLITMSKISEILHTVLLRNHLLNFWETD
jgi:hypothetical protein